MTVILDFENFTCNMWQIMANPRYVVDTFLAIFRVCELGTVQINT